MIGNNQKTHRIGKTATAILSHFVAHGPSTEREVMDQIRPPFRSARWGNSYFLHKDSYRANGYASSLWAGGYIECVTFGKRKARIFAITAKGLAALANKMSGQ